MRQNTEDCIPKWSEAEELWKNCGLQKKLFAVCNIEEVHGSARLQG
jgi:hypothetical protein